MKQYRITSKTFNGPSGDNCYLSPNDPYYYLAFNDDPEALDPEKRKKLEAKGVTVVDGIPLGFGNNASS